MKRALYGVGAVAAALALALGTLVLTFDIEQHKARLEAAASEATGMKVSILGTMGLRLFPRASLSLEHLFIQNGGRAVVSARRSVARIRFLPLLRREIRIREVVLNSPKVFMTRDATGRFNFETAGEHSLGTGAAAAFPDMERIFVNQAHVLYRDEATNRKIEAGECNLALRNLSAGGAGSPGRISFEGDLSCREAGTKELRVSDVRAVLKAGAGKFEANPVTMKIFGGEGKGSVRRVVRGEQVESALDFAIARLRFEKVLETFGQKKNVIGELDLEAHLTMLGKSAEEMTKTAQGTVSLRGKNLVLQNLDVDHLLERVDRSQHFNLVDVGAFLVAGPLGALLTKGYDFGSIYQEVPGAKSAIRKLVSDWKIRNGVAEAQDAAFTTIKNRFALKGKLDFVHNRFEDLSVAVLNAKGCAISTQKIHGDFKSPKIDPPKPPLSVVGAILALLRKPFELLQGGKCEVFYHGVIEQP